MARQVVMIGTSAETQGGVGAVISVYREVGMFADGSTVYLATHCDGGFMRKLAQAAAAWVRYLMLLLAGRVGLLHVHSASGPSFWRKFFFVLPTFAARRPVILHWHGGGFVAFYARSPRWQQQIIASVFCRSSRVVALSEQWRQTLTTMFPQARVVTIPNPVLVPPPLRRAGDAPPSLVFLGRVIADKGVDDLLQALPAVLARVPACRLTVAGVGDLSRYRAMAERLEADHAVRFPGWIDGNAKAALLAGASVFVLPSHIEAMPMSVLEAMAQALPVVATRVGGIPEAVRSGVEGLLVEPRQPAALAEAIIRLLVDAPLRRSMGEAGRRRVEEHCAAETVVSRVQALWQTLLMPGRSGG